MRLKAAVFGLTVGLLVYPSIGAALNLDYLNRVCVEEIEKIVDVPPPGRIPVGCEIIDCCPGCPGPPFDNFEWQIAVDAAVMEGWELRFENASPEQLKQLKISGNAKLENDRIVLRQGQTRITAIPGKTAGAITFGTLKPIIEKTADAKLRSLLSRSRPRAGDADAGSVKNRISVRQLQGAFTVNTYSSRYFTSPCRSSVPVELPAELQDLIRVQNAAGDNVVVMLDARGAACRNDRVLRTTNEVSVGNMRAAAGCNSEIATFSANNAMLFQTPVATWTNNLGDLHVAPMQPIINVPVTVWIANGAAAAQAVNDIANANLLYSQNKIGVQFTATINNVSGNNAAVNTIGTVSCGAVGPILASAFFTPNVLNIYYVNGPFNGQNCARTVPVGNGNINYIGTTANLATLAHEIGHAFGLRPAGAGGHTLGLPGFGNNNIMTQGGSPARNLFSLGQAFRMNTHSDVFGGTMLIQNGLRPGPGRACPPLTTSNICPALRLDWARP